MTTNSRLRLPMAVHLTRMIALVVAAMALLQVLGCTSEPATAPTPPTANTVPATSAGGPASTPYAQTLDALGRAYAEDAGLTFVKLEIDSAGTSGAEQSGWDSKLTQALTIGYTPGKGTFYAFALSQMQEFMDLGMQGQRSPAEVVKAVLVQGNVVVPVTWYFAGAEPVKSYVVFSPAGEPLFDTLISLPVIDVPIFNQTHL